MPRSFRLNFKPLIYLTAVLIAFTLIDLRIRPLIKTVTRNQAKVYATKAINNAIADSVIKGDFPSESMVSIGYSASGNVTSVSIDTAKLNQIKAAVTNRTSEKIEELKEQEMAIPLGTLIGTPILSGRGPLISFKILPAGNVKSKLLHSFDEAAINQTRHQIILEIEAGIIAVLPGFSSSVTVITDVTLAETVIVGVTPQSFTQIIPPNNDSLSDIAGNFAGD
ncbi:MAG: sporulation protein YunB [Oscillospiraceae bacterium]